MKTARNDKAAQKKTRREAPLPNAQNLTLGKISCKTKIFKYNVLEYNSETERNGSSHDEETRMTVNGTAIPIWGLGRFSKRTLQTERVTARLSLKKRKPDFTGEGFI